MATVRTIVVVEVEMFYADGLVVNDKFFKPFDILIQDEYRVKR